MRFLRRMIVAGVVVCGAIPAAPVQRAPAPKPDPVTLDQTMTWLSDFIAKNAGFELKKASTPGGASTAAAIQPVQEKLVYQFSQGDACHLSWHATATGDEDIRSLYPGLNQDEDFASIAPGSIQLQPMDVRDFLDGGTGEPAKTSTGSAGVPVYWKLTASYAGNVDGPMEAFGFLFADREAAQHVTTVLEHGISLCHGPQDAGQSESEVGCDDSPTKKVINDAPNPIVHNLSDGTSKFNGSYVNRADIPVSCVMAFSFYKNKGSFGEKGELRPDIDYGDWMANSFVTFDLRPGEEVGGNFGNPHYPKAILVHLSYKCYPQGAVNFHQNVCAELHHPLRWNPKASKEAVKTQQSSGQALHGQGLQAH